jgi:hypothetical protein
MEAFIILEEVSGTIHTVTATTLKEAFVVSSKHHSPFQSNKCFTQYLPKVHGGIDKYKICCNVIYHKQIK